MVSGVGRRRRKYRKRPLRPRPVMPTVFECPNCGARVLAVSFNRKEKDEQGRILAEIKCSSCGLYATMWVPELFQPVDVYSRFYDAFIEGRAEYTIVKEEASREGVSIVEARESGEATEEQS